ncbi:BREX-1 system phosphatase PglZ type A [Collinsella sp. An307]|uniref:BREX-1 system phosphatase PglZ type A n=1 Tax=Collinsella sp. An307 TaxID=1965630 RepID=UPI000B38CEFF|nr:BREX-1 system phosphatase PglZ type A [Collinsella sp. An307]OUO19295.1 TIGR02687 family protein [Collinsella sp. An307]
MKPIEIQKRLNSLFQTSPVIIWNDAGAEFAETLAELDLPGVEVFSDVDGDRFVLKETLNNLAPNARLLIYRPNASANEPDWLADAVSYAPAFAADRVTLLLDELQASDTPEMRSALATFSSFLSAKGRLRHVQELRSHYATPQQLALAVMATTLGRDVSADPGYVIVAYLCRAYEQGGEGAQELLKRSGVLPAFCQLLEDYVGYAGDVACEQDLATHVLLSTLTPLAIPNLPSSACSEMDLRHANDIARLWLRLAQGDPTVRNTLLRAASSFEATYFLKEHLRPLPSTELADISFFPVVDELLIRRIIVELGRTSFDSDALRTILDRRRAGIWVETFRTCYAALDAALALRTFAVAHRGSLAQEDAVAVWREYTTSWSLVDTAYRRFHTAFADIRLNAPRDLDAPFHDLAEQIESWYRGWFLRKISSAWETCVAEPIAQHGAAPGIPRLTDFYITHVDSLARKKKRTWVIISDALRYEVARELAEALEASTQGQTDLTSMQAPFPSITLCGMAALLPHDSYLLSASGTSAHNGITVTVDGMPTQGTPARSAILDQYLTTHQSNAQGLALQAADFTRLSKAERKETVGEAAVIYLYHNRIDATGDDATTENDVFRACTDTVEELCKLVSLIVRDFRASDILITADHGFLYTYRPLAETDKISQEEVSGSVVALGRRYVVGDRALSSPVMLPVSLDLVSNGELAGLCPHEAVRLKKAGGGDNYVHGGISLQELCVPVIHFKNYRAGMLGFAERSHVTLSLVTQLSAITNLTCSLEVLQNDPVGGKALSATYEVYLQTLGGELISDVATIHADRTSADATKRTFAFALHIRSAYLGKSGVPCQLVARLVADSSATVLPDDQGPTVLSDTQLQIAFAPEENSTWW